MQQLERYYVNDITITFWGVVGSKAFHSLKLCRCTKMGSVTLNVYTHNSYEKAEESMAKIVSFGGQMPQEKMRRFG